MSHNVSLLNHKPSIKIPVIGRNAYNRYQHPLEHKGTLPTQGIHLETTLIPSKQISGINLILNIIKTRTYKMKTVFS